MTKVSREVIGNYLSPVQGFKNTGVFLLKRGFHDLAKEVTNYGFIFLISKTNTNVWLLKEPIGDNFQEKNLHYVQNSETHLGNS